MNDACCKPVEDSRSAAPFLGRFLISLIFILAGVMKIFIFPETVSALQAVGIQGASIFTVVALLFELVGGLLILAGWYTRFGVYLLMIFLVPTTLIFHGFWNFEGHDQAEQMSHFLKNMAIFGGLLLLWSYGPGRWSIDACRCKSRS